MMGAYTPDNDADAVARDLEVVYGYFPILGANRAARRRLALRRAAADAGDLAGDDGAPHLMLLDEPSRSACRPLRRTEIFEIIVRVNASEARRCCWSSRTPTWRSRSRDHGYVLENGRIV